MKRKTKFLIVGIVFIIGTISILTGLYFNTSPKISLIGSDIITLNLNDEYKEEGVIATLFGKDISKDVKIKGTVDNKKTGTYKIEYTISNRFVKSSVSVSRTINIVDTTFPEIKLKGKNEISIYVGDKYAEPGFTASDNYDGDITKQVTTTNNINNKKAGTYEVKYTVIDSSGNKIETKRKITIKKKPVIKTSNTTTSSSKKTGYGIPVLMYHYFYDKSKGETGKNSNWMEISSFEQQLKYLDENNYYFPTWTELANFVAGKITLPKKSIVITIDDGHKSLYEKAIPVIEKYNVKATAFIITSKDSSAKFTKYKSDKINFQSHTHNMHKGGCTGGHGGLFRCINYDKGLKDLQKSIEFLGSNDALAYPYGDCTDNVLKITKASGFKLAFTTQYGKVYKGMNNLKLPRVRMSKGISLKGFINSIS